MLNYLVLFNELGCTVRWVDRTTQVMKHYGLADFSMALSHSRHLVQLWKIALADFTTILLHLKESNQVMKHYGLADFSTVLSHSRHLVQPWRIFCWRFYLDPAERLESGIERHGAGGFYHGSVTFQDIWCNRGGYSAGGFYLDPATLERVESGIEPLWAGGFFHGSVTFKTFGAKVEDCAGWFYFDPATLERVESGNETLWAAGGFFRGPVTYKTFGAIVEDCAADFTSILLHMNGSNQVMKHYGLADFSTAPSHSKHLAQ